jgi:hypothetical protein
MPLPEQSKRPSGRATIRGPVTRASGDVVGHTKALFSRLGRDFDQL